MLLNGYSQCTLQNYGRCIAQVSLHFNRLPQKVRQFELNEYLLDIQRTQGDRLTYFKHTVYGMKYLYRMLGLEELAIKLPRVKKTFRLPMVLSKEECKLLFKTPKRLKHRMLLYLAYGCGLRIRELTRLKVVDINFDRRQIHIRQSKYWKDRYVTLPVVLVDKLRYFLEKYKPQDYLFEGNAATGGMSIGGIQWVISQTVKKSGLVRRPSMHTLRHTFATHAIEDGQNLFRLKEQLGHENIETTMLYLHVARIADPNLFSSPIDALYSKECKL